MLVAVFRFFFVFVILLDFNACGRQGLGLGGDLLFVTPRP